MAVILVDCDNFFASCERALQPKLHNKPVAVLSNNDGCVIARTNDVKKAGVAMGQPYHECRQLLETIDAEVLSANFLLYRQFAKRIQAVLKNIPNSHIEVYSIDESFITVDDSIFASNPEEWASNLREHILVWTCIPVSIGVASSRSLAKLAVLTAKKTRTGIFVLNSDAINTTKNNLLKEIEVDEVWGVGRRMAPKFRICGIRTAYDLMTIEQSSNSYKLLNKVGRELVSELRGWTKLDYSQKEVRKSMMHTRSFGRTVSSLGDVRSVCAQFMTELVQKLWRYELVAGHVSVFLVYKERSSDNKYITASRSLKIAPTNDLFTLEAYIDVLVKELFSAGNIYKKAGIILSSLSSEHRYQLNFNQSEEVLNKSDNTSKAIKQINRKESLRVVVATELLGSGLWKGKREKMSPYNHNTWDSIPVVE
jgi:DNA polymerase V